ncbi:hypothetical protein D3C75_1221490 [compost metagenome]
MYHNIRKADQQSADVGKIIFSRIAVQQMGADNVGFSVIHRNQAVQTAGIGTERADRRFAALQMGSQNVQRDILAGNHYINSCCLTCI